MLTDYEMDTGSGKSLMVSISQDLLAIKFSRGFIESPSSRSSERILDILSFIDNVVD